MINRLQIFSILCALTILTACATTPNETAPGDTFNDAATGFSITKPSDWHYAPEEILEANRNANRTNNSELDKVSRENGDSSFLTVFTRYPEPNPKNNPTVSVTVVNVGMAGLPPKYMLSVSTATLKKAYPNLTIVDDIRDHEVDGIMGAYTRLKFTVIRTDDRKLKTMHRMWLVPKGPLMFSIAMTGPQEGPDVSDEAFKKILNSIKIERK